MIKKKKKETIGRKSKGEQIKNNREEERSKKKQT